MSVLVKLSTSLRARVPGYDPFSGLHLDLPEGGTAGDLAETLELPASEIKVIMVNGLHADPETSVRDGDRVAFFPAVGGG